MKVEDVEDVEKEPEPTASAVATSLVPQLMTTLIVCMSSLACGTVLVWTSPALPDIESSNYFDNLTDGDKSWIASSVTLGAVFSGPVAGYMIDKFGRRETLVILSFPLIFGWILIAGAPIPVIMTVGRLLTGFSIGGFILASMVYLAEISEQRIRGVIMSTTAIALGTGMLLTYILGTFFSWFTIMIVNACFSILLVLCIRTIPESPIYLLHKGQKKKAGEELMRLRGATKFHQIEKELNEVLHT